MNLLQARDLRIKWERNSFTTVACKQLCSWLYTKIHINSQIMEIQKAASPCLCGYLNTSWCKNITTISETLNIKPVFLMHNFKCIGLTELQKLNKTIILPTQHCCLTAKSLWNLKISVTFKQLSSAIKILHTKSILKGRRKPNGNFPI